MSAITIDLGGTTIKTGVIEKGIILAESKLKSEADKTIEENLRHVYECVEALLRQNSISKEHLTGVGISFPGIVNTDTNRVLSKYVKYQNANLFDFNKWAKEKWDLPVVVENDAKTALLGEWKYGAGKGYNNIVLLTLGTGVGSAVLTEGRLYKGTHFLGGSLAGHISINVNGEPCNCGYFGCLETEASTWVLPAKARKHSLFAQSSLSEIKPIQFIHLFEEAEKGDSLAQLLLEECLKAWGVCAVNIIHSYDPEIVIIAGAIMKRQDQILPYIQSMADKHAWLPPGTVKIVVAKQTEYASLLGTEYLVSQLNAMIN